MPTLYQNILLWWDRNERRIGLGGLALGFIFDLFLAKRPDSLYDNALLISYLFIAATIIIVLNMRTRRQLERDHPAEPLLLLLILQFCFGGLASNMLILYGKSGTLGGSALFVAILAGLALGNEFLKSRYAQMRFNIAVYYVLLLTYLIIAVPTFVLHAIGVWVFLLCGAASLVFIGLFLTILFSSVLRGLRNRWQVLEVSAIVLSIFLVFNGLYFLNIIPPVPLSLKSVGIYHSLVALPQPDADGHIYTAGYEVPDWWVFWRDTSATFHTGLGDTAYCYSAVFAPGSLSTPIEHRWEEYDASRKQWVTQSLVSFPINGGRAEGYRGWSIKAGLTPGSWRCDVETTRGQLIGRISFTVSDASTSAVLSTTRL